MKHTGWLLANLMAALVMMATTPSTAQAQKTAGTSAVERTPAQVDDAIATQQAVAADLVAKVNIVQTMFKDTFTPTETAAMMDLWNSPEMVSLPDGSGNATVLNGQLLQMSNGLKMALPGDQLERGVLVNLTNEVVFLALANGDLLEVFPRETVGINGGIEGSSTQFENTVNAGVPTTDNTQPPKIRQCNVTCDGINFFACCIYGTGGRNDKCKCRRVGSGDHDCDAGGAGSLGCDTREPVVVPGQQQNQ